MELLQERLIYGDTDSVLFYGDLDSSKETVPLGDYMGCLTDELRANEHIVEFVSGKFTLSIP